MTQAALVSLLATPMANAWLLVNPAVPSTMANFITTIAALVYHFGLVSAWQAAEAYEASRKAAGIRGAFTPHLATLPDLEEVTTSVRWATKDLWQPNPDLQTIQTRVLGVVEKEVLDTGRRTIVDAVKTDRRATGANRIPLSARWERECEPGACSFCAMLATRGPVYHSEQKADFLSHDHCRCFAEPGWGDYKMPQQVQEWKSLYQQSTQGVHGMKNMQRAFRDAYDAAYPAAVQ